MKIIKKENINSFLEFVTIYIIIFIVINNIYSNSLILFVLTYKYNIVKYHTKSAGYVAYLNPIEYRLTSELLLSKILFGIIFNIAKTTIIPTHMHSQIKTCLAIILKSKLYEPSIITKYCIIALFPENIELVTNI